MPNIFEPDWDEPRDQPGMRSRRAPIGQQLGTERLGMTLWELPPGQAAYPYHFHLAEEEVLVVLAGAPVLRAPDGERTLAEGEVVGFPIGEGGAHQLRNDGDRDVRFLTVSSQGTAEVVFYPDTDRIAVADRRRDGTGLRASFRRADAGR
jgi:uncharacterized cupin superfamily protein